MGLYSPHWYHVCIAWAITLAGPALAVQTAMVRESGKLHRYLGLKILQTKCSVWLTKLPIRQFLTACKVILSYRIVLKIMRRSS